MSWSDPFREFVREHAPLAPLTWYKLGGPARWLVEPRDVRELADALAACRAAGIPVRFLGLGANVLVDDEGVDAAVFRLRGPAFEGLHIERHLVTAAAGADLMELVKTTVRRGLSGLEMLAGIPATVGGAVRMNCGGRYGEIGQRIRSVRVLTSEGEVRDRCDLTFRYRRCELGDDVVLAATFELNPENPDDVLMEYGRIWREKMAAQPAPAQRSAGCIFKNPPGRSAGLLIDQAGLKGARHGGAEVSPRHANFILAGPGCTAADVRTLIERIRAEVARQAGVVLETEVEIWPAREAEGACFRAARLARAS